MPAVHGDLANTDEYFSAVTELLRSGATGALTDKPPAERDVSTGEADAYEAGPPRYPLPEEAAHPLMGKSKRKRMKTRQVTTLRVKVKAMDLRFVTQPIMVGHYEQDAISGAESIIDRDVVDRALSERYNMGLYAGPVGTRGGRVALAQRRRTVARQFLWGGGDGVRAHTTAHCQRTH